MCGHEILQFRIIFNSLHFARVVVNLVLKLVPNVPQKQQYILTLAIFLGNLFTHVPS